MTDYVLVHGAWGHIRFYEKVAEDLRAAGHRVVVPALTGLGTREREAHPGITLSTHVEDVLAAVEAAGFDRFVLAGHSYGGMIISSIAQRIGARVAAIVYVDAFLPYDGAMLWDLATDWERAHYIDGQRDQVGMIKPFPQAPFGLSRHPLLTLLEPVHADAALSAIPRKTYIFATQGLPGTFGKFRDRAAAEGWRVHELPCSHMVADDLPDDLTRILLESADAV